MPNNFKRRQKQKIDQEIGEELEYHNDLYKYEMFWDELDQDDELYIHLPTNTIGCWFDSNYDEIRYESWNRPKKVQKIDIRTYFEAWNIKNNQFFSCTTKRDKDLF